MRARARAQYCSKNIRVLVRIMHMPHHPGYLLTQHFLGDKNLAAGRIQTSEYLVFLVTVKNNGGNKGTRPSVSS